MPKISTWSGYSEWCIKESYKFVTTDYLLIVQHDGWILNPSAWDSSWLQYDYLGAPWGYRFRNVGNGGFSLRTRRLMEVVATDKRIKALHPEDISLCRTYGQYLEAKGFRFAPREVAAKFSLERWPRPGEKPFGFHSRNYPKGD